MFGTDGAKIELKKRLLNQFNLHTIIRLPSGVFSPYTSISTNILFFDKTRRTEKIWFYRVDTPSAYKAFSKTRPMTLEHFTNCAEWWNNRREIQDPDSETFKAKSFTVDEIINRGYDLDLCGYPSANEEVLSFPEMLKEIKTTQEHYVALTSRINARLEKISVLLQNIGGDVV
ncbi:MAG: N-6 DNA methylase [Selenomonadaceae bacterium]|nr:N-6 DNA methylase [Selenomonadaceae bacterium]